MTRRLDVLAALKHAGPAGVSGEALARDLGFSRAAVAKHIAVLRDAGYRVTARAGFGYVLESVPDAPIPCEVVPLVGSPFWVRLEGAEETGSTNDDCKALAREGAPEGTAVLAARQTSGRGRLGRAWESPAGGVYVSVLFRPLAPLSDLSSLPLAVSLGVARGLETLGISAGLKWPNDVWTSGGKLAGILLETSAEADRAEWVVAGIGVNVRRPARAFEGAAYLYDELEDPAGRPGLARVAAAVLDGISSAYEEFAGAGFAGLRAEYESRSVLAGRDVCVRDAHGGLVAEGRVAGTDPAGRLLVDGGEGVTAVAAGDVTLRPGAGA